MSIPVALNHVTDYSHDRLVTLSPRIIRLHPAPPYVDYGAGFPATPAH